jgi:excinuclease ABC subunit C
MSDLQAKLAALPPAPGVYLLKDARGRVLYVGKAARLAQRVRNYFGGADGLDEKTRSLVDHVRDLDWIVTPSEKDALLLESQLVQEYRPRYNVRLKDDKRFPYLRLRTSEDFPRIDIVRRPADDGDEYYGPFTDAKAMRLTLRTLGTIFRIRTCALDLPKESVPRPCLDYFIHRCGAPCVGYQDQQSYAQLVAEVRLFLQGRSDALLRHLRDRMQEQSAGLHFEAAARLRDRIEAVQKVVAHQETVLNAGEDADVLALEREGREACGVRLRVRDGKLLQSESWFLLGSLEDDESEYFARFCAEMFRRPQELAAQLLLMLRLRDAEEWAAALSDRLERPVRLVVPQRGARARLVEMARTNARFKLRERRAQSVGLPKASDEEPAILDLKERLQLPVAPHSIECFDMSHFQGAQRVGALVYFAGGKPLKSRYRRFKIQRSAGGVDDFAMMQECVERYYSRLRDEDKLPADLVVVDGGVGQLAVALRTLQRYGFVETAVVGLAKREEEIYVPGRPDPLQLPRRSAGLKLLQRVRDEAHRFAVTYHRQRRDQSTLRSVLDEIPGIGAVKRRALLEHFGSAEAVAQADAQQLRQVPGIGAADAQRIVEFWLARRRGSPV